MAFPAFAFRRLCSFDLNSSRICAHLTHVFGLVLDNENLLVKSADWAQLSISSRGEMDKTPFSIYDFLAYLSSGCVVVMTVDYLTGSRIFFTQNISPALVVALVLACYVTGHIVSQFSSMFFEQLLVANLLARPIVLLMGGTPKFKLLQYIFPGFCNPLPSSVIQKIKLQASARNCSDSGDGLFFHCYAITTALNDKCQSRLDDFRNQYGFARNMALAFLGSAIALSIARFSAEPNIQKRWIIVIGISGLGMLYRYLKFFRQYTYELLLRYAELAMPSNTAN